MMKKYWLLMSLACFVSVFSSLPLNAVSSVKKSTLQTKVITATVTPDIGGRLLHVSLNGQPNILKVGDEVVRIPSPQVTPDGDNIGYLGGEVWVGPQSQWWVHQSLNPLRRKQEAQWPPDPYLTLAGYEITQEDSQGVSLRSPESPISGVQFYKTYSLSSQDTSTLVQRVEARNHRDTSVVWDLWFNTRVAANTRVYVPVASANDVRVSNALAGNRSPVEAAFVDEYVYFTADVKRYPKGQRGKLFIQPSRGFIAAFSGEQLLVIRFKLLPVSRIHPEQGQVELYIDYEGRAASEGLTELEIHGEYATRPAGSTFSLTQTLSVYPYTGAKTSAAELDFLTSLGL